MNCVSEINDTHMEELGLYWIQYKKSLKHKLDASDAALHNQLSFFNSIIVQMSERCDSSNRQWKWMVASFSNVYGKN